MKRNHLLSLMVMLLQIVPAASFADVCIDGIYYNLDSSTKEAAVTFDHSPEAINEYKKKTYEGNITIPATVKNNGITYNVTSIEKVAFAQNSELVSVNIPNSITYISDGAFHECKKLKSITIPKSVTKIDYGVLTSCDAVTSIIVDKDNPVYDSRNNCNAIIETETNELIQGCQTTVIPNTVTRIARDAFSYISTLTSIDIPNSVTSIGAAAFYGCSGLTTITLPNSIKNIDWGVFDWCYNLKTITLSEALEDMPFGTFNSCHSLETVTVPASVTSIDLDAFWDCQELKSIYFQSTTPPQIDTEYIERNNGLINLHLKGIIIHVPIGYKDIYMDDSYWKKFTIIDDVVVPENTTSIHSIDESNNTLCNVYSLTGIRLHAPQKGINIINGKKVMIK